MSPKNDLFQRISSDPEVSFGRPVVRGTRIWVSVILDLLADGMSEKEIIQEYPQLTLEDVRAACAYGSFSVDESRFSVRDTDQ